MSAKCADADIVYISRPDNGRTIVSFQRATAVVIAHGEQPPLSGIIFLGGAAESSVSGVQIELAESVHMEDAAGGASAKDRDRAVSGGGVEFAAVKAAA